jgi:hypothetical protein
MLDVVYHRGRTRLGRIRYIVSLFNYHIHCVNDICSLYMPALLWTHDDDVTKQINGAARANERL